MVKSRMLGAAFALTLTSIVALSCSSPESLGFGQEIPSPGFVPADDGGVADQQDASLPDEVLMCAATTCPAPFATCPTSQFPCDVNLKTDANNCGACGVVCPGQRGNGEFACIDGACKMTCSTPTTSLYTTSYWADCNGLLDDDCEVELGTNDNCTACGDACPADKPCVRDSSGMGKQCGCDPGQLYCSRCIDPSSDDNNCGACNTRCLNIGTPAITNGYYGCVGGQCGQPKCRANFANCDGDMTNGCETSLIDSQNCGACGVTCAPGQRCALAPGASQPQCLCPDGKTLCGNQCVDLNTDLINCGACGSSCMGLYARNKTPACVNGLCTSTCNDGWGDCNGDSADGCETNLVIDPSNCGACGNACDEAAGQPCIGGQCHVEPCKPEEGSTK